MIDTINIDIYQNDINLEIKTKQQLDFKVESFAQINTGTTTGFSRINDITINAGQDQLIDTSDANAVRVIKYIVAVESNLKYKHFEINILKAQSDIKTVTHSIIGDTINIAVSIELVGNDLLFSITNNETNAIIIKCSKIYL